MSRYRGRPSCAVSRRTFLRQAGAAAVGLLVAGCRVQEPTTTAEPTSKAVRVDGSPFAPVNAPIGVARGIHPGRVVWVYNPEATSWDGQTGYWWGEEHLDQDAAGEMLSQALRAQTGQTDDAAAWGALFSHFGETRGRSGGGYRPGERVAIKINLNPVNAHDYRGNDSFTSPQMVYALLQQLVTAAGVPAASIAVYDATRYIPDCIYDRCAVSELSGVRFVDWTGGNGREAYARDLDCLVQWSGDVEGSPTYLPSCVTQADYVINLASLKGHNLAGVTLCAKNHLGSICADLDGKPSQQSPQGARIHGTIAAHDYGWGSPEWTFAQRSMGTYNALVDLMGHRHLGGKTLLYLLDALYVAHDQSSKVDGTCRWESAPFDGAWTSSLFLSQDGVAIDSVGLDFLRSEPTISSIEEVMPSHTTCENYLHEAAQAGSPPSGTAYDPIRGGVSLGSLGTHEHWNNAADKQYSRNLGTGEGIELVSIA